MKLIPLSLFLLIPLSLFAQGAAQDNASNLKGISYLYMNIDTSLAGDITNAEKLDLSDIMELQLRRGNIRLRPYVINTPTDNVPLVELMIDTKSSRGADDAELILRVYDYVTIDRNKSRTVATTFEMSRRSQPKGSGSNVDALKSDLRALMADFVDIFTKQNP